MLLKPGTSSRVGLDDWLNAYFEKHQLSGPERATATHLTYTLCRFWYTLDPHITRLSSVPLKKLETRVVILLKLGLIQLTPEVDSPDYAAIDETMKLAKRMKLTPRAQGFVHAILRRAAAEGPVILDLNSVFPDWLKTRWAEAYGDAWLAATQTAFCERPSGMSVRLNPLAPAPFPLPLQSADTLDDFVPEATSFLQALLHTPTWGQLADVSRVQDLPGLADGAVIPQDAAACAVSLALAPQPGECVLEIGAAPGGKTTHLAALMQNTGTIVAVDASPERLRRLRENLARMHVTNVRVVQCDMTNPEAIAHTRELTGEFDRILVDAPCSAAGILRKHPDVLVQLKPDDPVARQATQQALLQHALTKLKPGGILAYATCSVFPDENETVVRAVLTKNAAYSLLSQETLPIGRYHDGFYLALIQSAL